MDPVLEDTDLVDARFTQATAVIDLIQFAVTRPDMLIGLGVLDGACMAADELLRQGHEAFRRIDKARPMARPKAR